MNFTDVYGRNNSLQRVVKVKSDDGADTAQICLSLLPGWSSWLALLARSVISEGREETSQQLYCTLLYCTVYKSYQGELTNQL